MKFVLSFTLAFLTFTAHASKVEVVGVTLMQPQTVFSERNVNMANLSSAIQRIQSNLLAEASKAELPSSSGFFVLAFNHKKQVKLWFDFKTQLPTQVANKLRAVVDKEEGITLSQGYVLLALNVVIDGSKEQLQYPFPSKWKAYLKEQNKQMNGEQIVQGLWP